VLWWRLEKKIVANKPDWMGAEEMRSFWPSQNPSSESQSGINGQFVAGTKLAATEKHMKTIHPFELEALIEANQLVEVLDLRPSCEFGKRRVPGSHSIPFNEFDAQRLVHCRELPLSEPIYVISDKGEHARMAAEDMELFGLDNLVVVEGGLQAWERSGLPLDRSRNVRIWLTEPRKRMVDTRMAAELCDTRLPN
jgi:rhodanese-related sulfurtransferase